MKKLIIVSVALLVAGGVAVRAADAKVNWEKHCAKCHGQDGKGKTGTGKELGVKDYTDAKVQGVMTNNIRMLIAIRHGVKEGEKTRMPAFGETLSVDEMKALVQYVRGLKQ
jgi:mono/diheme cytochrome c family protein